MKKSPLSLVKEQFGSKEQLVDALTALPEGVLSRGEDDKDAFRTRLLSAANSKLIRLHKMGRTVAERWGSKDKLVDALLLLQRRGKDEDYRSKLSSLPLGKLYDQFHSLERAAKRAKA
ncbi:MAG TPA: hypothetical protein PKI03_39825 [Pseudomonadota bacterium]|jgi:hypothetical protein|nr:hypothetical protein [Pseudomonadota bacterium]